MARIAKCSIMKQIEKADDRIQESFYQVDILEKKLRSRDITDNERDQLHQELEAVKQKLTEHEKTLKTLHKENSKTFMITAIIVFFTFLVYGIYVMWKQG